MGLLKGLMINQGPAQAREGASYALAESSLRMLLMGHDQALSGESGRQRRGGQACRYPTGGFRAATIPAYFPPTDSVRRDLERIPGLCPVARR